MKQRIAIVDADLIGRLGNHFPNLACMKISSFYKKYGYQVQLERDYTQLGNYTCVFISKVFTDTPVPIELINRERIKTPNRLTASMKALLEFQDALRQYYRTQSRRQRRASCRSSIPVRAVG